MSRGARWSLLGLVVVLLVVGQLQPDPRRALTPTTFGTTPIGYQGVFDLLTALDVSVERSYEAPPGPPGDAPVWWIEPAGICRERAESRKADAGIEDWRGEEWIAAGGTAVIFLSPDESPADACASLAGIAVPTRRLDAPAAPRPPQPISQTIGGVLTTAPRVIEAPELATFSEVGDFAVGATLGSRPFVLTRSLERGRLAVVADARVLRNEWLDRADAAPFVMDLVRAYGAPRFDERSHGLHRERAPLRYLVRSPALPVLLGALAVGLLTIWYGRAVPARGGDDTPSAAPTLVAFVDSLACLYASSGDHARVLARYRQLAAARLRRHFGLPADTPLPAVLDRLARTRRLSPQQLAQLGDERTVRSAAGLRTAVRALDAIVEVAVR